MSSPGAGGGVGTGGDFGRAASGEGSEHGSGSSEESDWMADALHVPADCESVPEAVKRAEVGQTIVIAAGEYSWPGRIDVDKVLHIVGERDPQNATPLTVLNGRWRLCVPPPVKWDMDPITTGSFTDVRCQTVGGYCVQMTGMHWEMINSRFLCSGGTAMFVHHGHLTMDRSWAGGLKDDMFSNSAMVVSNQAKVFLSHSALRNSKNGAFLRDQGALFFVDSEVHRVSVAFGCELPNECEMEVARSRLHEVEDVWHQDSRPTKLIQKGNYDVYGKPIHLHGDCDGTHTFQTQDLKSK